MSIGIQRMVSHTWLPYGAMAVNILGCLLIGLLAGLDEAWFWAGTIYVKKTLTDFPMSISVR